MIISRGSTRHVVREAIQELILPRLDRLEAMIRGLAGLERYTQKEVFIMASRNQQLLDQLRGQLMRNSDAVSAMTTYVQTLLTQVEEAKDDPDELQALVDGFRNNNDALVAAAVANTPADPNASLRASGR